MTNIWRERYADRQKGEQLRKFRFITITMITIILTSIVYAQAEVITVNVTQIDIKKGGKVKIGIFISNGFPVVGKEVFGSDLEAKNSTVSIVFKDISTGKYAIAVFQDVNSDGILNLNVLGIPKEPYGFSTNKFGKFGPPDFEDVSFEVKENNPISLTINLE
jgi:uncharacterized protein (DUF2141 family)